MSAEKKYKKFSKWVIDLVNTCISFAKVAMRIFSITPLPKTHENTCVILGNGPSLKLSIANYAEPLKKHQLFCVNNFSITEQYTQLKPSYYVMLDPGYWIDENPHYTVTDTIKCLNEKTQWPLQLLVPSVAKKSNSLKKLCTQNNNIKVSFFNYTVFKGFSSAAHFFFKHNMAAPQSQNVVVVSLFLAINCGFKKIFLMGADHTWHQNLYVDENNQLCLKDVHFYDNEEKITYQPFYKDPQETETFKMHEILSTLGKTFYGYEVINTYAKSQDAVIYNASEVSFIDAFERKKLN